MPAPVRPVDELGFPIPAKFDDPPAGAGEPRRAKPSVFQRLGRWRWVIVVLVPLLLFGREIVDFGRGLVANFLIHRADRDWQRGDFHRALDHFAAAAAWEPDVERRVIIIVDYRAEIHRKLGELDAAMGDYNQAIALLTDGKSLPRPSVGLAIAHDRRAYLHECLGHHREALDDSKEALVGCPVGPPQLRATMLNDHAYMCALTGMELQSGEHDIDEAIQIAGNDPAFLDTRAYVRFRLGQYDVALNDLQMAIRMEEGQRYGFQDDELLHRNLAVMYHHRGEVYEKLGQDEKNKDRADFKQKAEVDFHRAAQLGFDPKSGVF
jgi:tetratricopeptide (TPR) repeat protein